MRGRKKCGETRNFEVNFVVYLNDVSPQKIREKKWKPERKAPSSSVHISHTHTLSLKQFFLTRFTDGSFLARARLGGLYTHTGQEAY